MRALFSIALAIAVLHCCGFGLSGVLTRGLSIPRRVLSLPLGYAASQLVFFAWLMLTWQTKAAALVAFLILGGLSLAWLPVSLRRGAAPSGDLLTGADRERRMLWAGLLLVALLAAWPHAYCGWGAYWHSGNPDILDALYARDIIIKYGAHMNAVPGGAGWLGPNELPDIQRSIHEFFELPIHLQYTSMVFWSYLLNSFEGMDVFLVQAVVNLLLMAHGVYFLGRRSLGLRPLPALSAAMGSVLCNFYFTTFVNGHEGSMMFMAVLPYVLLIALEKDKGTAAAWRKFAILSLLCAFLGITYPFPLGYFLIPYLLHAAYCRFLAPRGGAGAAWQWFRSRSLPFRSALVSFVLTASLGSFALIWRAGEYLRDRSQITFRSWRITETIFRDTLFWGLWPSPVAYGESGHANIVNLLRVAPAAGWPITILSLAWAWTLYGLVAFWAWRKRAALPSFYLFFAMLWPILLASMLVVIGDPYFVYKFMYTTQFLFILLLAFGFDHSLSSQIRWKRAHVFCACLFSLTIFVNLINDISMGRSLTKRQYNSNFATYQEIYTSHNDTLRKTSLQIPLFDHERIIRYFLANKGIETRALHNADYVLTMQGFRDVLTMGMEDWRPVWQNSFFTLRRVQHENIVQLRSNIFPEFISMVGTNSIPFRWVSDQTGFNLSGGFRVSYSNVTEDTRYLRFCVEPGPSYDYQPFNLPVLENGQDQPVLTLHANARTCFWIDLATLASREQPLHFAPERRGKSLLPYDERKLDFQLAQLGLTTERHDRLGLLFLTAPRDIVPPEHSESLHAGRALPAPAVLLGNGWYQVEQQAQDIFRWAEKDAQILVLDSEGRTCRISVEVECGPKLVGKDALLIARDEQGTTLWCGPLGSRTTVRFSVPTSGSGATLVRLVPSKAPGPLPNDPRALAFRVFHIGIEPEPAKTP